MAEVEGYLEKGVGPVRPLGRFSARDPGGRTALLTRIRVRYRLKVPKDKREAAERALLTHDQGCSIFQSIKRGIDVEWGWDIEEVD